MAQRDLNLGTPPAGTDGDTVREAFEKVQANTTELYQTKQDGIEGLTPAGIAFLQAGDGAAQRTAIGLGNVNNTSDAYLLSRANHTGSQLASTISDFAATVRSTVLTGLVAGTNVAITATDTILQALEKLQAQLSALGTASARNAVGAGDVYARGGIVGTVSSDGSGVPTGAIIERGSNANGAFVKFADGTMMCTVSFTGYSAGVLKIITLPAPFAQAGPNYQAVSGGVTPVSNYDFNWTAYADRTTAGFISQNTEPQNIVTLLVVGRWR